MTKNFLRKSTMSKLTRYLMPVLFSALALSITTATRASENPAMVELDNFAKHSLAASKDALGYPCSQKLMLTPFYKWLLKNKLDTIMINNAGDPFTKHSYTNSGKFEADVVKYFSSKYGFSENDFWGIVTFSGTDGNNHGIYFGANYLKTTTGKSPIVYISKDAHYSNMRLCDMQNLDFRLIDTDKMGRMLPDALEKALVKDQPALIVYAMGSTFKGAIDDQALLNKVVDKVKPIAVYRHVDAALFGGYLPYTDLKELVDRRVQPFDSIAVSGHKFFGMDEPAGIFLTTKHVYNNQKAFNTAYLNGSMPMINCSRSGITPLKFWWVINHGGDERWTKEARGMLEHAKYLADQLEAMNYPHYRNPGSNTVFFKRPSARILEKYGLATDHDDRLGGDLAHVVVMQHVNKQKIDGFIADLKLEK